MHSVRNNLAVPLSSSSDTSTYVFLERGNGNAEQTTIAPSPFVVVHPGKGWDTRLGLGLGDVGWGLLCCHPCSVDKKAFQSLQVSIQYISQSVKSFFLLKMIYYLKKFAKALLIIFYEYSVSGIIKRECLIQANKLWYTNIKIAFYSYIFSLWISLRGTLFLFFQG